MKYITILFACLLLTQTGCKPKTGADTEKEYLAEMLAKQTLPATTEWVILLPGLGCHGCIQEAETFMKEYVDSKNTSFILTRIESIKILQQKTGVRISEHNNITIDSMNLIKIPTDNVVYPCIIHVKNGKYLEHAFQSPQNSNAFNNLKMLLKNQHS